jgi:hypothetical protein
LWLPNSKSPGNFRFTLKRRLTVLLAICLAVLGLVSTVGLIGSVFARGLRLRERRSGSQVVLTEGRSEVPTEKAEQSGVNSFIIQMFNHAATCRAATVEEIPSTLPRPDDRGVPVRDLWSPHSKNQAAIRVGENSSTGLTINLVALSQLRTDSNRATVIAAFNRAAAIWTARIKSPVTININIDYGVMRPDGSAFPSGILGSTSSGSIALNYPTARDHLIASSSSPAEAALYNSLPAAVVPTNTGDGSVVEVSRSLAQSLGFVPLNPNDTVATISFNKSFAFDFTPDDGIAFDRIDFVAVAAHEIGHALGFISNAGRGSAVPVSVWDVFRFRPGITTSSFTTAQRIMSIGGGSQVYFTGQAFVVEGIGTHQLGLSTGGPEGGGGDGNQSSHWKDDDLSGSYIGIMDPTIASGEHEETTENDFSALETLGWNLVDSTAPPPPPPPPSNDDFANARVIVGCSGSVRDTNLNATKQPGEPNHSPDSNGGTHSVWYRWQSPSSGNVAFSTAGSGYDTVLAIYVGTSVEMLAVIGKNDDIPDVPGQPHNVTSSVTFAASAGTVYWIAVDGYNNGGSGGDMGPLKLNWTESNCIEPPPGFLIEEGTTNRAVALDSVTFFRGPFSILNSHNFSADRHTRVILFTSNLGLSQPDPSTLTVQAGGILLTVETVGTLSGVPGLDASYVIVRLPDGLAPGNLPLTLTLRGVANSNAATLGISP